MPGGDTRQAGGLPILRGAGRDGRAAVWGDGGGVGTETEATEGDKGQ